MSDGRILVVLPTLGRRLQMLEETLQSVARQRDDVELTLTVVLPASATAARALATAYDATLIDDPSLGISHAINLALEVATDEVYYAWIGDDDLFRPGGLCRLKSLLDEEPAATVAYGGCDYIDPAGRTIGTSRAGRVAKWILPWGPDLVPHIGSMMRIDAMRAAGLYATDLKYAMDLDLLLAIRPYGRFIWTKESVSAFRWHPDSLTVANRGASTAEAERIKRRHLPPLLRPISPLWNLPVRAASAYAARTVSHRAKELAEVAP